MAVSPDAVTWGYRLLLGRDPESEEVVAKHLGARDELHLAETLLKSAEFAARQRQFAARPIEMPELAHLEIESEATPADTSACLEKIKAAWSHLGVVAPHFSVLTDKRFLPESLRDTIDDFWETGRLEAERAVRTLARHGFAFPGKNR